MLVRSSTIPRRFVPHLTSPRVGWRSRALLACDRVADARAILQRFLAHGLPEIVSGECRPLVTMLGANARLAFDSGQFEEVQRLSTSHPARRDNAGAVHLAGLVALRSGACNTLWT